MAAIQGTRVSSPVTGIFVVAVAAALLVGGAGGYLVRALSSQVSGSATAAENRPAAAAGQLPAWVQNYNAPAEAQQFKVDELIRSLSYAPVRTKDLPAWVQQYMAPAATPQFKVDDLIRSLDYASSVRTVDLPAWVQRYMTPVEAPRFKVDDFIASLS
jgi:cell division protein FtsN